MTTNIFAMPSDVEVQAPSDSTGKFTFDSGVEEFTIKLAYLDESKPNPNTGNPGGAHNVNLILDNGSKTMNYLEYVTSGKAKGQKPYYEKDGKKMPLPGFSKVDELCKMVTGKGLAEQDAETKTHNIWDKEAGKEIPQAKATLMDLIGKKITAGVIEVKEDKYNSPGQVTTKNEVSKWFDPETNLTAAEIAKGITEPVFMDTWKKKWTGEVLDKTTKTEGTAGAPAATASTGSLFS